MELPYYSGLRVQRLFKVVLRFLNERCWEKWDRMCLEEVLVVFLVGRGVLGPIRQPLFLLYVSLNPSHLTFVMED